jgi:hypothetical protein
MQCDILSAKLASVLAVVAYSAAQAPPPKPAPASERSIDPVAAPPQNVPCTGNRATRNIPSSIGSRSRYCKWFSRENPTETARIMPSRNPLGSLALGIRFRFRFTELSHQLLKLQLLEHRRHGQQATASRQILTRKAVLCRGTDFIRPA